MTKYKVETLEVKIAKNNNKYAVCELRDTDIDAPYPHKVSLWQPDWIDFDKITFDTVLEGTITEKNGYYTLYPQKVSTTGSFGRSGGIKQAQETKRKDIEVAQGNKEHSIKVASTMSMACQTAIAFLQGESIRDESVFKSEVKRWRTFYWKCWDDIENLDK